MTTNMKGLVPESWSCIDCGTDTAPGLLNRVEIESAIAALGDQWHNGHGVEQSLEAWRAELYTVRNAVWKEAGMKPFGGCLCIGCLEKRLGRRLRPKDFQRGHPFNGMAGTQRLLKRRGDLRRIPLASVMEPCGRAMRQGT
jgi:hypothetical protein